MEAEEGVAFWRESKGERRKKEILKCPARGVLLLKVPGAEIGRQWREVRKRQALDDTDQRAGGPQQLTSALSLTTPWCLVHPDTIFPKVLTRQFLGTQRPVFCLVLPLLVGNEAAYLTLATWLTHLYKDQFPNGL